MDKVNHTDNLFSFQSTASKVDTPNLPTIQVTPSVNDDNSPAVKLSISSQGLKKFKEEQENVGKDIAEKTIQAYHSSKESSDPSSTDSLDKIIEQLKEKIKEINAELQKLKNDNSKAAKAERKALEAQLISLQGSLINTIGKKLDSL